MATRYIVRVGTAVLLYREHNEQSGGKSVRLKEDVFFSEAEIFRRPGGAGERSIHWPADYVFDLTTKNYEGNPYRFMVIPPVFIEQKWDVA